MPESPYQVRLAVEVASLMSATPPVQLDLVLRKLGISGMEPREFDPWDQEAIVHDFVASISTASVRQIADYYGVAPQQAESEFATQPNTVKQAMAFISFDSADKLIAGEISSQLNKIGVSTFLAHRDISGGLNWRSELMSKLDETTAMICVVGENYYRKPICSQEIGWAWSRGIPVVPCSIHDSVDPSKMGFLSDIQFIFHSGSVSATVEEILENLLNRSAAAEPFIDALLDRLARSTNFDMAIQRWNQISKINKLSLNQVSILAKILEENYQVKKSNHGRLEPTMRAKITSWVDSAE